MSPDFRRVALIAAALGLLVSLFLVLRPNDDEPAATTTAAPAATETEPAATTAPKPPDVVKIRIVVASDETPTTRHFAVKQGRNVELVVDSEIADEVHIHGYDLGADVAPGQPATISFAADAPGLFEIELEQHHFAIAELEVRP